MTEPPTNDPSSDDRVLLAIWKVANGEHHRVCTRGIRSRAAALLLDLHGAMARHGITPEKVARSPRLGDAPFAAEALDAVAEAAFVDSASARLTAEEQVRLLTVVSAAAATHLDVPELAWVESPQVNDFRSYVVLRRLDSTPRWGRDGDAPLLVALERSDMREGAWTWRLWADNAPYDSYEHLTIAATGPDDEAAADVGELVAAVLAGKLTLRK